MRRTVAGIFLILLMVMGLFLLYCGKKPLPPLSKEELSAGRVWKRISMEEKYTGYKNWPGHEGMQSGQSPHGVKHVVYINDILSKALPIKNRIAPYGSMIVKENYNSSKELKAVTVMIKTKGYNPNAGDWFWAKFKADGNVEKAGKVQKCIECHKSAFDVENDYVVLHKLDAK